MTGVSVLQVYGQRLGNTSVTCMTYTEASLACCAHKDYSYITYKLNVALHWMSPACTNFKLAICVQKIILRVHVYHVLFRRDL